MRGEGGGTGKRRKKWKNQGGQGGGRRGSPGRGGIDWEAELPMAVNQLAPVPGSLGEVREALRRLGSGGLAQGL